MRHLIVVPARGGSKGIPNKNIYPVCGKPLLAYTLETVLKAGINGDIAVSTDSDKIAAVASAYDGVVFIRRPEELAADTAGTEGALLHALAYMEEQCGCRYDTVITMQPTSPLRRAETIADFVRTFEQNSDRYDSQLTLTESRSDYWTRTKGGGYTRLFPDAPRRRQDREPLYIENSALYITKRETLLERRSVLGEHINGYLLSEVEGVDINEPNDIRLVEFYLSL